MSAAYLGTSDFAVGLLDALKPDLVVTRPDRPKGRGRQLQSPPVAIAARERGIEVAQPEDVNAFPLDAFDDVVVCAYGALIKEPLLSHPGLINVHPSLLPRWRGAAPLERAIMAGDAETGVCIMGVVAELDAGPVFLREHAPIGPEDTYGTLSARLQPIAGALLARYLAERPVGEEQGPSPGGHPPLPGGRQAPVSGGGCGGRPPRRLAVGPGRGGQEQDDCQCP